MKSAGVKRLASVAMALFLSACSTLQSGSSDDSAVSSIPLAERVRAQALGRAGRLPAPSLLPSQSAVGGDQLKTNVIKGTGNFINRQAASRPGPSSDREGEVTLNFELADIRDVIKVVFDTLGENYILDPRVQGEVTVQTSRPLPRDLLIPTLETLLQANGATLVRTEGIYKILPLSEAVRGNLSPRLGGGRLPPGYGVRIFPLQFISATEMQTILEPFAPAGGILLADPIRNLLVLAGTSNELRSLHETIEIFDVNWLQGMSVGMFVLENIESSAMSEELNRLFGADSQLPLAGLYRFVPIDRLNAIMVITPQPQFLDDISVWIEKLDGSGGERLFVYEVKHGNAEYIASLLGQVYEGSVSSAAATSSSAGRVAPGRTSSQLTTSTNNSSSTSTSANFVGAEDVSDEDYIDLFQVGDLNRDSNAGDQRGPDRGISSVNDEVRIVADTENNSLLIWASSQNHDKILNSLQRIDVPRRQVLIEATIAEVTLGEDLRFGLQWFFKNNNVLDGRYDGSGLLDLNLDDGGINDIIGAGGGFSYALTLGDEVRALLEVLAGESKVRILSSPQILVVDNEQASIRVGDQQPVRSSTTVTEGGNTVESIQFKDTGVFLEVQPQINAGGLVALDITQEVTDVGEIDTATGQRSFLQRSVTSKINAQSGQTIVLGGLIRERISKGRSGIPGLYKLPIVGPLFGGIDDDFARTELVILITPKVINNSTEAQQVTDELRNRMRGVVPLDSPWAQSTPIDAASLRAESDFPSKPEPVVPRSSGADALRFDQPAATDPD